MPPEFAAVAEHICREESRSQPSTAVEAKDLYLRLVQELDSQCSLAVHVVQWEMLHMLIPDRSLCAFTCQLQTLLWFNMGLS